MRFCSFLLLIFFYTVTSNDIKNSSCSKGCLSCELPTSSNPSGTCLVCDSSIGYYNDNDGKCFYRLNSNCEIPSTNYTHKSCFRCSKDHILNNLSKICKPLETQKIVKDCTYYHWDSSCRQCNPGYYIQNGLCIKVKQPIKNCLIYASQKNCLKPS